MGVLFLKPSGENFAVDFCEKNLNLLAHAQAIELEIGSECGGHGVCGGDRVRIFTPESPVKDGNPRYSELTEAERLHLSDSEIAQGWRLACQCFPEQSDDELMIETKA